MKHSDTHRELIEACKRQDRQAQYRLYDLYAKAMYNICLRMLNDAGEAEDMLQNSFIDVFSKLHYFQYKSSVGAWMKRIVINNCINHLKKRRLEIVPLEHHDYGLYEDEPVIRHSHLSVDKIKSAVQQLPNGYRVVLTLYLFEGYDHAEIAEILNISVSTSKSQYNRAKKRLSGMIKCDDV